MKIELHKNPDIRNRPLRFALGVILTAFVVFSITYTVLHKTPVFGWLIISMGCLILLKNAIVMFFQAFGCDPLQTIRNPWLHKTEEPKDKNSVYLKTVKNRRKGLFSHAELRSRHDEEDIDIYAGYNKDIYKEYTPDTDDE